MKANLFLPLLAVFLLFATTIVLTQEKSTISVKGSQVTSGVLIVDVIKGSKTYELQCNDGVSNCTPLKSGKYQMIELPKNTGMYECRDVEIYPETGNADPDKKIGEYCLTEK